MDKMIILKKGVLNVENKVICLGNAQTIREKQIAVLNAEKKGILQRSVQNNKILYDLKPVGIVVFICIDKLNFIGLEGHFAKDCPEPKK